ncbi:hypothetical protein EJB05_07105, partial [Eragrostis curvula]
MAEVEEAAAAAALPLPDDALAAILARLPPRTLAASRCVCKAWRAVVDARGLLLPHVLPHELRGIFINFMDYPCPNFFARPSPSYPRICRDLNLNCIIDHCNGLLLCGWRNYCVVNPATRRWDRVPEPRTETAAQDYVPYLVFDPAVSPHYEVFLIPTVPVKPKPVNPNDIPPTQFNLKGVFSDDTLCTEDTEGEEDEECIEEQAEPPPPASVQVGYFPTKRLSLSEKWKLGELLEDTYGSMEWPPSPCILHVFSSSTRRWEERTFVRQGEAMGTVEDMRLDSLHCMSWGPRWRYGVYRQETLYIHCRGGFVMRLSLTTGKYRIIKTPVGIDDKYQKSYVGRSVRGVYFATISGSLQLQVWILNESCGQIGWVLKCHIDLESSALRAAGRLSNYHTIDGPWILMNPYTDNIMLPEGQSEWDSDDDDNTLRYEDVEDGDEEGLRLVDVIGFHPFKEVVFLMVSFGAVAYNLNTSKIQWLGKSLPEDYDTWCKGVHEAFPYTPCMIGELPEKISVVTD